MDILNNSFVNNVLKVSTGTFLAQILMLIGMPIIARLYSKDVIGIYALFISTIGITTSFVTLAFDNTLLLPKKNSDANALLKLTLLSSISLSFIIYLFLQLPIDLFNEYKSIAFFIFLGTFLQVGINSFGYYKVRYNLYNQLSISKVVRNLSLIILQMGLFYINTYYGLLLGFLIASVITIGYLIKNDSNISEALIKNQSKLFLIANFNRYNAYPKYFCWSNLIFALSSGLPVLIFNEYFSLSKIAIYSIATSIIVQPAGLISSSIRPVLLSKFVQKVNNNESIKKLYNKTFLILLGLGLVLSIGIYFILPNLVTFIFGDNWSESGKLTRLLIPVFLWYFISIPSSVCSKVYPFQKYTLYYTIVSLLFKIGSVILVIELNFNFNYVILIYALTTMISDLSNHFIINNKIRKQEYLIFK